MCKLTVAYEERLGKRRTGWMCFAPKTNDFAGLTDKMVKNQIQLGDLVNGLILDEQGEVVVDKEFTGFMLSRTGVNTFTPMDGMDGAVNKSYMVVQVMRNKAGNTYRLISNRCGVEDVNEEKLKAMLMFMSVGGVKMENNKLVIHKDIEIVNVDMEEVKK